MKKKQNSLATILHKFSSQTVGVLGDFMLDELLRGEATRISPEAPVPVVRMDGHSEPQRLRALPFFYASFRMGFDPANERSRQLRE